MTVCNLRVPALIAAFSAFSGSALAQEVDCANAMAQADLNRCSYQDWQAKDAALNDAYAAAMELAKRWDQDLPEDERGAAGLLRDAQRAWIAYRDAACAVEGFAMRGGSAEPLLVNGCMASLTEVRTADLRAMVEAYGDL